MTNKQSQAGNKPVKTAKQSDKNAKTDSTSALPLYMQAALELKAEIIDGVYPVGSLIPTEDELCKRFSVSRYTVREALRVLREEGLVTSRRGAGTVVVPSRSRDADIHQVMSINDLLAFGTDTRFAIDSIQMVTIDERLAARTGLAEGEEWLQVLGYRRAEHSDESVGQSEYYINRAYAAVGRILLRHDGPIFPLIEDMFGQSVSEVHQQITATLISKSLASQLDVKESSAALEIRRTYNIADGTTLQVTINTHPASRYKHSMTLQKFRS